MTKKRFIKLVMAYGVHRNEAAALTGMVQKFGSYAALYESLRLGLGVRRISAVFCRIGRAIRRTAQEALPFLEAIPDVFENWRGHLNQFFFERGGWNGK